MLSLLLHCTAGENASGLPANPHHKGLTARPDTFIYRLLCVITYSTVYFLLSNLVFVKTSHVDNLSRLYPDNILLSGFSFTQTRRICMKQVHRMVEIRVFLWEQQQLKQATAALAQASFASENEASIDSEEDCSPIDDISNT